MLCVSIGLSQSALPDLFLEADKKTGIPFPRRRAPLVTTPYDLHQNTVAFLVSALSVIYPTLDRDAGQNLYALYLNSLQLCWIEMQQV